MGFGEHERRVRERRANLQQQHDWPDEDEVLTFAEWCQLNKIGQRTGRRILKTPTAPVVTQLSTKRIGITRGNNRRWQQSRARG